MYTDGTSFCFENWHDGNPDNSGGTEDCVEHHNGQWNDNTCSKDTDYAPACRDWRSLAVRASDAQAVRDEEARVQEEEEAREREEEETRKREEEEKREREEEEARERAELCT